VIRRLQSYHRRRIAIPVTAGDLVLDVGSGDKPHWRADVLLDSYVAAEFGSQRVGGGAAALTRPLFVADAAAMPFADRAFDYVVCSHVLEHVTDPAAVIAELVRVAEAGYIEVPRAGACKIRDFPTHLWWCSLDGECLVFRAKEAAAFDPDIDAFVRSGAVGSDLDRLLDRNFDDMIVSVPWVGSVAYRVEGIPAPNLISETRGATAHHRSCETLATRALRWAMTIGHRGQRRRSPVMFNAVVADDLRLAVDEPLRREIYRL
jgi:SAM-dependent methyltransferase